MILSYSSFCKYIYCNYIIFKILMSASHKFELALHLRSFQNIGVRQTCVLQLRTVVYHSVDKKNMTAKPYEIINIGSAEYKDQSYEASIEDETFLSPKIVIKNLDKNVNLDWLCLFKGEISIPNSNKFDFQIYVYSELIWHQGKQMEVIGEWKGYSKMTNFCSYLDIYFSTHMLTCSVNASAHCVLTQITIKGQQKFGNATKDQIFYNHSTHKASPLYDACIDPLISSLAMLSQWTADLRRTQYESLKDKNTNTSTSASININKFKWNSLSNKLKSSQNLNNAINALVASDYIANIKADFHNILITLYPLWKQFLTLFQHYPQSPYIWNLKKKYHKSLQKDHWLNRIIVIGNNNEKVKQVFEEKGQQLEFCSVEQHSSQIKLTCKDMEILSQSVAKKKQRLIVLVHGFQASSFDMENIAMYFKFRNPDCFVLISEANQGMTEGVIEECGHRLAIQVKNFINSRQLKDFSISFIGHSLGGLIIRACLRYLQLYKNYFECYISICSPHMGYLYHTSKIVTTSLWVMNQVKKDQSMIELAMSDNKDLYKCYLYELSQRTELNWFKTVILMGSKQDEYVPFSSALLQDMEFFYQSESAKVYKAMFNNIVKPIQSKIIRLQILFNDKVKDLSGFIGRTAHIKVLSFLPVIDLYCHLISKRI